VNKSTINYILLALGILLLLGGLYSMSFYTVAQHQYRIAFMVAVTGIYIILKQLKNTKELPSRNFKNKKKDTHL